MDVCLGVVGYTCVCNMRSVAPNHSEQVKAKQVKAKQSKAALGIAYTKPPLAYDLELKSDEESTANTR